MKKIIQITKAGLLIVSLLFFYIPKAQAADTFYVATSGNDSNPGTLASPWRTIQKAMNSATAGSIVNIRGGTYNERLTLNVSGTAENYTTFQPYGFTGSNCGGFTGSECVGEKVIMDYTYLGPNAGTGFLTITNKSYLIIQGLTFQNFTKGAGAFTRGVNISGSSFITIKNNKFFNNKDNQPWDGSSAFGHFWVWSGSNNITILGNEFGNIISNYGETLTIDGANTTNVLIEKNYIHDTDALGVDLHGGTNNWTVRNNRFEYISIKHDGSVWYNNRAVAIYGDGGSNGLVENNFIDYAGVGLEYLSEPGQPATHDITIRNNIVQNSHAGIVLGTWYSNTDGSSVSNLNFYNNTLYNNGEGIIIRPTTGSSWKNNIFANNSKNYVNTGNWSIGSADYNLFFGSSGAGNHIISADPQFVNVVAGDFHLKFNSPAINAGTSVPVPTDKDGVARPVGAGFDMGAYEFGGTPTTPTPTPSPTPTPPPTTDLHGDLNKDSIVNSLDWSIMNSRWFTSDSTADLNKDGIVNSLDFSIMNGNWLKRL